MSDELKPKLDDFTAKVVTDPAKPQETLLLQGFLGASSQPDHTRVYSDLALDSYVDVANADIIHIEQLPKEQSPMGGSYLWVKKETEAVSGTASAKAKFLQGPIASEASQVTGVATQTVFPKTIPIVACHPTILARACTNTSLPRCHVQTLVCPTRPVVCEIVASGTGPCTIPDPTIHEGTWQFQPQQQFAAQAQALQTPQFKAPSVHCPTIPCHTLAVTACHICPPETLAGRDCPIHTTFCPQQQASLACGEQITVVGGVAAAPAQQFAPAAATLTHPCLPATHVQCPSVNHFKCPPKTSRAADCPPTPQIQHCPTPNNICPRPTSLLCPSVTDVCPTSSPIFC